MDMDGRLAKFILAIFLIPVIWICCAVGIFVALVFATLIVFLPLAALFNPDVILIKDGKVKI